jgi:HEAT repeat protein
VNALVAGLKNMPGARTRNIQALGDSQNRLAIPPLTELLTDPNSQTRAAAAEALAKLGAVEAISKIRPLLSDPVTFPVQLEAAGALYRLNDMSGVSFLRRLENDPNGAIRLMAAQQMSSTPDPTWLNLVRGLLRDPDPMVRLEAARLLAPHEPDTAKTALDALLVDPNVAVREASGDVYVAKVSTDFPSLRRRLRSPDLSTGVRAAARILELTR